MAKPITKDSGSPPFPGADAATVPFPGADAPVPFPGADTQSDSQNTGKANDAKTASADTYANGLPSWSVMPPDMPVRRKSR